MKSTTTVPQKRKQREIEDEDGLVKDGSLTSAAENFFEALCMEPKTEAVHASDANIITS